MRSTLSHGLTGIAALCAFTGDAAATVTVAVVPSEPVFAEPAGPGADLMLQNIILSNREGADATIEQVRVDLLRNGRTIASYWLDPDVFVRASAELDGMSHQGPAALIGAQLLDPRGLAAFGDALSDDATLARNELLVATATYLSVPTPPDTLRVEATYRTSAGEQRASTTAPVSIRPARLGYGFPLRGIWQMRGLAGPRSHHRRIPPNEFALDFFRLGADGAVSQGDNLVAQNSFGYGQPVLAAADGEVVSVIADAVQDRTVFSVREGETRETAGRRIQAYAMARMASNFRRALAGNLVTIRHRFDDGRVEYSSYGHLAAGSVRVAVGDRVARGDVIAAVGDTGDSATVHLHFQLNAGPDPFFSRSLPVRFDDMRETFAGQDAGLFVTGAP